MFCLFGTDLSSTSSSEKELSKPSSSSQLPNVGTFAISPKDIRPLQHFNRERAKTKTTKSGKTAVLTESPYKNELIAEIEAREKKPVKRNLNLGQEIKNLKGKSRKIEFAKGNGPEEIENYQTMRKKELDLDFLERRQNATSGSSGCQESSQEQEQRSPIEISPESVDRIKVILLGAPAVGKTSIIQQFVWNDFCEDYIPTERKHTYYPSVITNERLYEIKISDLPVIPYFPVNSYYEWANYRYYGLRSATAYILVFDLSNIDTFQYVRTLREQICESRNMQNVPLLVVGNKQDLIVPEEGSSNSSKPAITSSMDEKRRDIVNLVKKHWKSGYIECSAKYNWKVVAVFKELINMIDNLSSRDQSPMLDNIQEALDRNKCIVI